MGQDPSSTERQQRIAKVTLAVLLALLGLWVSASFLPAIIWATVIAIAINPLYLKAEARWPKARNIALPGIATLLIALLFLVPLGVLLIEAVREAKSLLAWIAAAQVNGIPEPAWVLRLPFSSELSKWWQDHLATPEGSQHELRRFQGAILVQHSQLVGRDLIHRSIIFFFTLIALFFTLRDREVVIEQFHRAGERLLGASGERLGQQVILSVRGTIDGLVLVGIGEGVVLAVVYLISGVPHPLLFGAVTAIAAMIPFGAPLIFTVAAATLLMQGSLGWAIAIIVIGTAVLFVADHVIRPVLIGGATRLPFLWVLIGILGGVEALGLLGLFVGPATMATLMLLWRDYISTPDAPPLPEA
jgi:predicted PurR-regulated permease PerM